MKAATPLPLHDFVVDLRERLRAVWRELDGADPRKKEKRKKKKKKKYSLQTMHAIRIIIN